jgi:hypoxanthine-guanine phosphoribosyltransferase
MGAAMSYATVLFFLDDYPAEVLDTGLTLEEAQAVCNDPESSSKSCTTIVGKRRTKERGAWFIGWRKEED